MNKHQVAILKRKITDGLIDCGGTPDLDGLDGKEDPFFLRALVLESQTKKLHLVVKKTRFLEAIVGRKDEFVSMVERCLPMIQETLGAERKVLISVKAALFEASKYDRYRRALEFVLSCDNFDMIRGYVRETLYPTPYTDNREELQ